MAQTTVRIREATRETLRELARSQREPMLSVLEKAVEEYRRRLFLESVNEAYAALRSNPREWAAELRERAAWDGTLEDGLPSSGQVRAALSTTLVGARYGP